MLLQDFRVGMSLTFFPPFCFILKNTAPRASLSIFHAAQLLLFRTKAFSRRKTSRSSRADGASFQRQRTSLYGASQKKLFLFFYFLSRLSFFNFKPWQRGAWARRCSRKTKLLGSNGGVWCSSGTTETKCNKVERDMSDLLMDSFRGKVQHAWSIYSVSGAV